jgi:RNA recognition motif-containing protein
MKRNLSFMGSALVKFKSLSEAENAIENLNKKIIPGASKPVNIKWLDT